MMTTIIWSLISAIIINNDCRWAEKLLKMPETCSWIADIAWCITLLHPPIPNFSGSTPPPRDRATPCTWTSEILGLCSWSAGPQETQECCCVYFANVRWNNSWGFVQTFTNVKKRAFSDWQVKWSWMERQWSSVTVFWGLKKGYTPETSVLWRHFWIFVIISSYKLL